MYHRIAEPPSDVWEISVSPENFEQHLQVLKSTAKVISLGELAGRIQNNTLDKKHVAISFDDGYIDNLEVAKPLLEKYEVPATIFITSGNIDTQQEFWWDELEQLILFSEYLPPLVSMVIGETLVEASLEEETQLTPGLRQQLTRWKGCTEPPPTKRAVLFYKIWQQLRPLTHVAQQQYLEQVREIVDSPTLTRPGYRTMSAKELKHLAASNLVTIGAHTVHHPALAYHPAGYQENEILQNRNLLREITGAEINLLSYPFGNFNNETTKIVSAAGFSAAFSTEEIPAQANAPIYSIGRFQVKNQTGAELAMNLKQWRSKKI